MAYTPIDVMTYSLDNLGLSGKVADFSKDFIFSMNFDGKSYWEKCFWGYAQPGIKAISRI